MPKKTIRNNQLTPGKYYYVRGNVVFSRVGRPTRDDERKKRNETSKYPINNNYTYITICNATVICNDVKNPSVEEIYAKESLYGSSNPKITGKCFTGINKSTKLPGIRVLNEQTGEYDEYNLNGKELASGLDVIVVMRVFSGQGNNGVSLDQVIVTEPVKFYQPKNAAAEAVKRDLNIVFSAAEPINADDSPADEVEDEAADSGSPEVTDDPFVSIPKDDDDDDDDSSFASASDIGVGNRTY